MVYDLVAYHGDFDAQIAQLQTHLWGDDPTRNAAYFRWKYKENPYLPEPLIQLATSAGRVVGMRGMVGALWEVDEEATPHVLPYADDLVIAPEHRNRGLVNRIMKASVDDAARRGFGYAVNLSAGPVTFIASLASGWRSAGAYQPMQRQQPAPFVARALRAVLGTRLYARAGAPATQRDCFARFDAASRLATSPIVLARQPRPEEMAQLVGCLPWDGRIRHRRDAAYFQWRFRNPLHDYRFAFWNDSGLQGYLVLQRYLLHPGRVNIVDWEGVDDGVRAELLAAVLAAGRFARTQVWTAGTSAQTRALLKDYDFAAAEAGGVRASSQGLLLRSLAEMHAGWQLGSRNLLSIADWDLRMIYSMAG